MNSRLLQDDGLVPARQDAGLMPARQGRWSCAGASPPRAAHAAALAGTGTRVKAIRESKRFDESQDLLLLILAQIPESLDHVFRLALMSLDRVAQRQRS